MRWPPFPSVKTSLHLTSYSFLCNSDMKDNSIAWENYPFWRTSISQLLPCANTSLDRRQKMRFDRTCLHRVHVPHCEDPCVTVCGDAHNVRTHRAAQRAILLYEVAAPCNMKGKLVNKKAKLASLLPHIGRILNI